MLSWMDWLIVGSAAISVFTTRSSTCVHRCGQGHAWCEQEEEDGGGCVCVAASCVRVSEQLCSDAYLCPYRITLLLP